MSVRAWMASCIAAMSVRRWPSVLGSCWPAPTRVAIEVTAEALAIVADQAVAVGLIVNELAMNAIKHAFPGGQGRIVLGFQRIDGEIALAVADDRVGLAPTAGGGSSGLGSRFVDAFVRQIGSTLAKATGKDGTTFTVRLPASILAEA